MTALFFLPVYFLTFWFGEAPLGLLRYFREVNRAFLQFFSVFILLRTFFHPIKNEYREGLVGFSIGLGIFFKSCILLAAFLLFIPLLIIEALLLIGFLIFPLITLGVLLW